MKAVRGQAVSITTASRASSADGEGSLAVAPGPGPAAGPQGDLLPALERSSARAERAVRSKGRRQLFLSVRAILARRSVGTDYAMYLAIVILWGAAWFAISLGVGTVAAEISVLYRFGLAGALLLGLCWYGGERLCFSLREHASLLVQGTLMFGANYVLLYRAIEIVPSGVVAVIYSTIVLLNVLLGALMREVPIRAPAIVGGLLGMAGVACIYAPGGLDASGRLLGLAMAVAGTLASSISQLTAARNFRKGMPLLPNMAYAMLYGAGATLVYCVASSRHFNFDPSLRYIASLGYLVVFASLIGFGFYLTLVRRLGADRVAYASVLYPVVALSLSSLFEDFQWSVPVLVGVGLALLGNVVILTRGERIKTAVTRCDSVRVERGTGDVSASTDMR